LATPDVQAVIAQIREGQLRDRDLRKQLAEAVPNRTAVLVHADDGSYVIVSSDQRVYEIPVAATVDFRSRPGQMAPALPVAP
jgi:tricorn protease-like protein